MGQQAGRRRKVYIPRLLLTANDTCASTKKGAAGNRGSLCVGRAARVMQKRRRKGRRAKAGAEEKFARSASTLLRSPRDGSDLHQPPSDSALFSPTACDEIHLKFDRKRMTRRSAGVDHISRTLRPVSLRSAFGSSVSCFPLDARRLGGAGISTLVRTCALLRAADWRRQLGVTPCLIRCGAARGARCRRCGCRERDARRVLLARVTASVRGSGEVSIDQRFNSTPRGGST